MNHVAKKQHPLEAKIAVVSKPENNGGLVSASSPRAKEESLDRTLDIVRRRFGYTSVLSASSYTEA